MNEKSETALIFVKSISFRQDFYKAIKSPIETPDEWLIRIKQLAKQCDFGKCFDLFVLDKFITGLESEIIDYLCSCATVLGIDDTVNYVHTYQNVHANETDQNELTNESHINEEILDPFQGPTEVIFSESLVKCEETEENHSDEDNIENDFSDHFIEDDSKDSDFLVNNSRDKVTKTIKNETVTKVTRAKKSKQKDAEQQQPPNVKKEKEKNTKKKKPKNNAKNPDKKIKTENQPQNERKDDNVANSENKATDQTEIDPNAPKNKRKYKKRAVKEKQTFECEICQYKCSHECHLRRHKLIHKNEKSFVCHICGKAFNLFINMNAHIRRHIGIKNHTCEVCKHSFMDRARLKLHMRTHTGERPFACSFCDKRFADRYYLKVHTRLHTGEKPFRCDQCQKVFSQSSSLSVHKRKNCIASLVTCT